MKNIWKTYEKDTENILETCVYAHMSGRKNIQKRYKKHIKNKQNDTTQICSNMCHPTPLKDTEKIWKTYEKHIKVIQKWFKKDMKKIRKTYKKDAARNHVAYCSDPPVQITCSHWVSLLQPTRTDTHTGYLYNSPPEQILTWTIPQHCPWGQLGGWGSPGGGGLHHSGGGGGSRLGVPGGWLHAWGRVWQPSRLGGTPPKQGVLGLVCLLHTHRACSPIMVITNR